MKDEKKNGMNKDIGQYFPHMENLWIENNIFQFFLAIRLHGFKWMKQDVNFYHKPGF